MTENKAVKILNEAFQRDPNAIKALFHCRVCSEDLTNNSTVITNDKKELNVLSILNGILIANSLPRVAVIKDENNSILGFCEYVDY